MSSPEVYNLSWRQEWRTGFLESSRILTWERYADDVAQRLVDRIRYGLSLIGKSPRDIKMLACVTAPAMLLASAIRKWWPTGADIRPPHLADLGHYALLNPDGGNLGMQVDGDVLLVQDVMDTGEVSGKLLAFLQSHGASVAAKVSFVRFVDPVSTSSSRVTDAQEGWLDPDTTNQHESLPSHALLEIPRPPTCAAPEPQRRDSSTFWIEPRALGPISYEELRREFEDRDPGFALRDKVLRRLDDLSILAQGHYV